MKLIVTVFLVALCFFTTNAQDVNVLFKQADNFETQLKETEALNVYKQILIAEPANMKALLKATELSCSTGERLPIKNDKRLTFESALAYAQRMVKADSTNADSYYALALASGKMTGVETENKKVIAYVRDIKINADKALKINPNHAMANFAEGKWHYELVTLNGFKKLAVKTLYGGLPEPSIDDAIKYLEKCKTLAPYFALNYLTLAKAYKENSRPAQAIEVLNRLVKLPIRVFDDTAIKAEGQKMLQDLQ
jgi:tetratricopeptide (TPR) repeat protein